MTFSLIQNLKTVFSRINCRWQVFQQQYAEFSATISNAIISEAKDFSGFSIAFLKITWNLEHFQKKDEYNSLIISEIIDTETRGYLKVQKVLLQNTIR